MLTYRHTPSTTYKENAVTEPQFKMPAGPNELHPVRGGMDQEGFQDFRAKAPTQTAFEQHLQQTAFQSEQKAKADAQADADDLLNGEEPKTAFELEMSGGRRPLGATASAQPSLFDPTEPESSATVEKGKSSTPEQPTPPKPPSVSSPKSGPDEPSV
ncbi:hypothetical protein SEA_ADGERS_43 [Gordonia phage Adgers]|uniref:Uncharacterized protein n=1 Tax=Gordonia phage Adgers TaxID=2079413 RepID=A0A2L1IVB5_9CAUD|nr:endonuclease [Gordonia phage Adgers]AVD99139.1 hypothetical protein SEA_ADGERS_43 [Gordonia phage Adgers]